MLSTAVPTDSAKGKGAMTAMPLISLCCLGIVLLLIASTVVLALIPIYLSTKSLTNVASSTGTKYATLSMSQSLPAYGNAPTSSCNTIASAMNSASSLKSNTLNGTSCSVAAQSGRRRRRRSRANYRISRTTSNYIFIVIVVDFILCPACRGTSIFDSIIGRQFSASFLYFGQTYSVTFTIITFGSLSFGNLVTDATPTASTMPTTSAISTASTILTTSAISTASTISNASTKSNASITSTTRIRSTTTAPAATSNSLAG